MINGSKPIAHIAKIGGIVAIMSVSACAQIISGTMNMGVDESQLKAKSADYFKTSPENVTITDIHKGALNTDYKAEYSGNLYACTIAYSTVKCQQTQSLNSSQASATKMTALQAQSRLNQLGFSVGEPDGIFGKKSVEQLKLFQKSRGLPQTGKLDTQTVAALR